MKSHLRSLIHQCGKKLLRYCGEFQGKHSLLPCTPFIKNSYFKCAKDLEGNWRQIYSEFKDVWKNPDEIPSFHEISPDQKRISKGKKWKTFALFIFGNEVEENCDLCPDTTRILRGINGLQNAWFSILAPGYKIPPHRGPTRALIRCHLGLLIPSDKQSCWIRVDRQRKHWEAGSCMFFDDTFEHEVENNTKEYRAVLFIDLDRPMDRVGSIFNKFLLAIIQSSHYVKDPLKNLKRWNTAIRNKNCSDQ